MRLYLYFFLFTAFIFSILSCNKEFSFEGNKNVISIGNFDCNSFYVNGHYVPNSIFTDSNYIICKVDILKPGAYKIYSDTINGFYFEDSGYFTKTGLQVVAVKAFGKANALQTNNFNLYFGSSSCSFYVLPGKAVYTFVSSNNNCDNNAVFGTYDAGIPLTLADSAHIQVNVAAAGVYELQTSTVNGISFLGNGFFTKTGVQSVLLFGAGSPQSGGTYQIPISLNNSNCSFQCSVNYKRIDTSMYYYFEAEGKKFSGYLDSARADVLSTAVGNVYTLSLGSLLTASADTLLNYKLSRINNNITVGTYHSAIISNEDFAGGMIFSTKQNFIYYSSNNLSSFHTNLINYNGNNRLITGEFDGPVIDSSEKKINIINGVFKTYLSH